MFVVGYVINKNNILSLEWKYFQSLSLKKTKIVQSAQQFIK